MIELLLEAERLLSVRLLDRAEALYQQVATTDPRNSIAVVGLARVALERDDDLGAYLLARRALAIDPENDAARRLATRLEEVLATRGEPVEDPMPVRATPVRAPMALDPDAVAPGAPASPDATTAATPASTAPSQARKSVLDRIRRR